LNSCRAATLRATTAMSRNSASSEYPSISGADKTAEKCRLVEQRRRFHDADTNFGSYAYEPGRPVSEFQDPERRYPELFHQTLDINVAINFTFFRKPNHPSVRRSNTLNATRRKRTTSATARPRQARTAPRSADKCRTKCNQKGYITAHYSMKYPRTRTTGGLRDYC
jgi:hypothetical protein